MPTILPVDANNYPVPVLRLRPGAAQNIAVSTTSVRCATAFNTETRVVGIYATSAMFVRFGDSTATAATTDHYIPADTYMDVSVAADDLQSFSYVAAIRNATDGILYISEKY
jgi:hypothetical protein